MRPNLELLDPNKPKNPYANQNKDDAPAPQDDFEGSRKLESPEEAVRSGGILEATEEGPSVDSEGRQADNTSW